MVRRDALSLLTAHKAYFSGGTVLAAAADSDWVQRCVGAVDSQGEGVI